MIEFLPRSHDHVVAIKVGGKLTARDYEQNLIPRLDALLAKHDVVNLLIEMDDTFHGWTLDAAWDDAKFGLENRARLGRVAVVGAPEWVRWCMAAGAFMMKGEMRAFPRDRLDDAWAWVDVPALSPA